MSQRTFSYRNLEVLTGWDVPLQYFFLVVENQKAPEDDARDGMLFSNLRLQPPGMTLETIDLVLRGLGVKTPKTLYTDLLRDKTGDDRETQHIYPQ